MAQNFIACFVESKNDNDTQKYIDLLTKNEEALFGLDIVKQDQLLEWASSKDLPSSAEIKSLMSSGQPVSAELVASVLQTKFEELAKAREDRILNPPEVKDPKDKKSAAAASDSKDAKGGSKKDAKGGKDKDKGTAAAPSPPPAVTSQPTEPLPPAIQLPVDPTGLRHAFILQGFASTPQDILNLLEGGVEIDAYFVINAPTAELVGGSSPAPTSGKNDKSEKGKKESKGKSEKEMSGGELEPPVVKLCEALAAEQENLKAKHEPSLLREVPIVTVDLIPPTETEGASTATPDSLVHALITRIRDTVLRKRAFVEELERTDFLPIPDAELGASSNLRVYEKLLKDVPEALVSVPLILHCLVEQVAHNVEEKGQKSSSSPRFEPSFALSSYLDSALSKVSGLGRPSSARKDPAMRWSANPNVSLLRHGDTISSRTHSSPEILLDNSIPIGSIEFQMLEHTPVLPNQYTVLPQISGPNVSPDISCLPDIFPFLFSSRDGDQSGGGNGGGDQFRRFRSDPLPPIGGSGSNQIQLMKAEDRGANFTELYHFVGKEIEPGLLERELLLFEFEGMVARCDPSRVWDFEDRTWAEDFNKETLLQVLSRHVQLTHPDVYLQPFPLLDSLLAILHTKVPPSRIKNVKTSHKFPESPNFSSFFENSTLSSSDLVTSTLPSAREGGVDNATVGENQPQSADGAVTTATENQRNSSALGDAASAQEPITDDQPRPERARAKRLVVNDSSAEVQEDCTMLYPADGAIVNVTTFTSPEAKEVVCSVVDEDVVFGFHARSLLTENLTQQSPTACFKASFDDGRVMVSVREVPIPKVESANSQDNKTASPSPPLPADGASENAEGIDTQSVPALPEAQSPQPPSGTRSKTPAPSASAAPTPTPPAAVETQPTDTTTTPEPAPSPLPPAIPPTVTELSISFPCGAYISQLGSDFILQSRNPKFNNPKPSAAPASASAPTIGKLMPTKKLGGGGVGPQDPSSAILEDTIEICTWTSKRRVVSKVVVRESSRAFIGKGTVVRYFESGHVQCLFANSAVSTRNTDGTWLITNYDGQRCIKSAEGELEQIESLLIAQNLDPETRTIIRTREDLVMVVQYEDGTSLTQHQDGTRMWIDANSAIRVESAANQQSYFPVIMYPAEAKSVIELPDRASLICFYDMSMHFLRADNTKVNVDLGSKRAFVEPASLVPTDPASEDELGARGVYTFDYVEGGMVMSDYEGNKYLVNSSGSCTVQLSAPHLAIAAAAVQHSHSVATSPTNDLEASLRTCIESPGNILPITHHPRLFVIRPDGTGTEFMRFESVQSFLGTAKNNPKQTTILDEPLIGSKSTRSYTFLTKDGPSQTNSALSQKKPIPKCVTPVTKSMINTRPPSARETLFFRQLVEYQMLDDLQRQRLRESANRWSEWNRKRDLYSATLASTDGRTDREVEDEREVQKKIYALIQSRRQPTPDDRPKPTTPPIEEQHHHTDAATAQQPRSSSTLSNNNTTSAGGRGQQQQMKGEHERPNYFHFEDGSRFLAGSHGNNNNEDALSKHSSMGPVEPPRYHKQKTERLTQTIRQQSPRHHMPTTTTSASAMDPTSTMTIRSQLVVPPTSAGGATSSSVGKGGSASSKLSLPRQPSAKDVTGSVMDSTMMATKGSQQTLLAPVGSFVSSKSVDVYGRPRATPSVQSLKKDTATFETNKQYGAVEGQSRRHVNTVSVNQIKQRRDASNSPTRESSPRGGGGAHELDADGASFSVTPARVQFGEVLPGYTYRFAIQVSNHGTQSGRFRVKGSPSPLLSAIYKKNPVAPGMSVKAEIELQAKEEGMIDEVLEVHAEHRIIKLPVSALISPTAPSDRLRKGVYVV